MDRTDRAPMTEEEIRAAVVGELKSLLYEQTKRELVTRSWRYVQNHADAKTAVIEAIIERGRGATAVGSHPRTDDD